MWIYDDVEEPQLQYDGHYWAFRYFAVHDSHVRVSRKHKFALLKRELGIRDVIPGFVSAPNEFLALPIASQKRSVLMLAAPAPFASGEI